MPAVYLIAQPAAIEGPLLDASPLRRRASAHGEVAGGPHRRGLRLCVLSLERRRGPGLRESLAWLRTAGRRGCTGRPSSPFAGRPGEFQKPAGQCEARKCVPPSGRTSEAIMPLAPGPNRTRTVWPGRSSVMP